ncbi:putative immunoglobulin-blocking virulence protein [Mycoplasma sp. CSL7491-lung]|uniref:putative immunoglobulin-blocking virulence protein n=1 Tax=Mycoplasma sp. CSL7491-lung TaxID=549718 RepID=UPI001C123F3D|nr:putative immunoglobulin-blocking virulence protein [Mycoplasma sp. CSL7491-lung]MBU4693064.1 putative immunoglobulin-blocking virulence protein [Mycoplasma sp. CSL7491-lung]
MFSRKVKVNLIIGLTSASVSALSGVVVYATNNLNSNYNQPGFVITSSDAKIISKNNLDLDVYTPSVVDRNIKEKPEPKPIEKPQPKPIKNVVIDRPKPIEEKPKIEKPKEVIPEVIKEPIKPKEEPKLTPQEQPKPKPKEEYKTKTIKKVYQNFGEVEVSVTEFPERQDFRNDVEKGIVNRVPYRAEITPDLNGITVTDQLIARTAENARKSISTKINTFKFILNEFNLDSRQTETAKKSLIRQNEDYYIDIVYKFGRLLQNGDKIKEFLTDEGVQKYDQIKQIPGTYEYYDRAGNRHEIKISDIALITYIDFEKFKNPTLNARKQLEQGYFIDPDDPNIYITENGELDSHTYSPIVNKVTAEYERNNTEKRVFGFKTIYTRNPEQIANGGYYGWSNRDVTSNYASEHNLDIQPGDGIKVDHLTRDTREEGKLNEADVITIDASNNIGYKKALKLINDIKEKNIPVVGFRFKNIGKNDSSQKFKDIFAALPNKIPLLELFLESTNTSSLRALKDKEIDEMAFYTTTNSLVEEWNLNPWAVKGAAWVNTADYNVSFGYASDAKIVSRITFDSLSFDKEDFIKTDNGVDATSVNNGLRMAYWVRNNEKIFQGGFGPGLKPDRNEAGNSYPVGLDLSRVPAMKSLRYLVFNDIEHKNPGTRKLRRLVLFNDRDYFEIDTNELNNAQFYDIIDRNSFNVPKSKIIFSNGKTTNKIRIKGTSKGHTLNPSGFNNLNTLIDFSDNTFSRNTIIEVPQDETNLINQLRNSGYNVSTYDEQEGDIQWS